VAVLATSDKRTADSRVKDEKAAVLAARDLALSLDTYDYSHLDADFAKVLAGSTDPFKTQYAGTSAKLKALLVQYKATATSTIGAAGVAAHTGSTVTVILFVDQTVTNTNTPQSRIDRNRLQLTMRKVHGRWLASDAQVL
jgi:Mce-associated membrane protein